MSLVAWYPLNGDLKDKGILGNDLINNGAIVSEEGKIGKCYEFTSSSHYMETANEIDAYNQVSLCAWINVSNTVSTNEPLPIISIFNNNANGVLFCLRFLNNKWCPNITYYNGNVTSDYNIQGDAIPYSKWVHIAAIIDFQTNNFFIYLNGEYYGKKTNTDTISPMVNTKLYLNQYGSNYLVRNFRGYMNDIRVYDHCLSDAEVKEISKGLVLHYTMDSMYGNSNLIKTNDTFVSVNSSFTKNYGNFGGSITANSDVKDTYCFLHLTENIEIGETYTLSFMCSEIDDDSNIIFSVDNNSSLGAVKLHTGKCSVVFTPTKALSYSDKKLLFDDTQRTWGVNQQKYTLSEFKLERGTIATVWCPNITDPLASSYGLDKIYDSSGFGNDGQIITTNGQYPTFAKDNILGETSLKCYAGNFNIKTNQIFYDNINQCHTVSFWIKPIESTVVNQLLINFNVGYYTLFEVDNKTLCYINYSDNNNDCYVYGSALPQDEWTFVTWVFDHNNEILKVYYNGEFNASTWHTNISQKTPRGFQTTTGLCNLDGYVDDIRIYATALDEKDILKLYQEREKVDNEGNLYCSELNEVERRVEYLENTSIRTYIDTGIIAEDGLEFKFKLRISRLPSSGGAFGGARLSSTDRFYIAPITDDGKYFSFGYKNTFGSNLLSVETNKDYVFYEKLYNGEQILEINGDRLYSGSNTEGFISSFNIYLFGYNYNNISGAHYFQVDYFKIYKDGQLVRDFLPMISTEEGHIGEACLFDTVTNTYFYNQGTGKFTTNLDESITNIDFTSKGIVNTDYIIEGKEQAKIKNDGNIIEVNNLYEN